MSIEWRGFAGTPYEAGSYWHDTIIRDLLVRAPKMNLLVTPGHFRDAVEVNAFIDGKPWIVWVLGDEEGDCPFWEVNAPVWRQFPNPHRPFWPDHVLPLGYTPNTRPAVQDLGLPLEKKGWAFAGQDTNQRRHECVNALTKLDPSRVHPSPTFAGGIDHAEYMKLLWESEWAPCPAGNVRADSFRMWEALEAGAVPLVDATSAHGDRNVWPDTIGDSPIPVIASWHDVGDYLSEPAPLLETAVWYTKYKRDLIAKLQDDWIAVSGEEQWDPPQIRITTVITASPIPSNPAFDILAETVESVRARLPNEIIIAFDGPRECNPAYSEHIRRVAWHANQYWPEAWIWYDGRFRHQAGTLREVLPHVRTGAVLMMEHDTPITGDIPWDSLVADIYIGEFNSIRLHYDASIHPEHAYLMKGIHASRGYDVIRTLQWSQRPHVALTQFYRDVLSQLPEGARTYVEDWFYGNVANSPWEHHKLGIFKPNGDMKRSYHLDGRAGIPKEEFWW